MTMSWIARDTEDDWLTSDDSRDGPASNHCGPETASANGEYRGLGESQVASHSAHRFSDDPAQSIHGKIQIDSAANTFLPERTGVLRPRARLWAILGQTVQSSTVDCHR